MLKIVSRSQVIRIHPQGNITVHVKFHGNPSHISVWTKAESTNHTDYSDVLDMRLHHCILCICCQVFKDVLQAYFYILLSIFLIKLCLSLWGR